MNKDDIFIKVDITDTLDLHTFRPADVKDLVPEYIELCRRKGIRQVRIIHGKGTGVLRRTVHSLLSGIDGVESFRLAGHDAGSWGATIAVLKPLA